MEKDNYLIKILFIEDNDFDAHFYKSSISRSLPNHEVVMEHVKTLSDAEELYKAQTDFHLVLLDLNLPDSVGVDTLKTVLEMVGDLPVIVLSGIRNPAIVTVTQEMGARSFFVKGITDGNIAKHLLNIIHEEDVIYAPEIEKLAARI